MSLRDLLKDHLLPAVATASAPSGSTTTGVLFTLTIALSALSDF